MHAERRGRGVRAAAFAAVLAGASALATSCAGPGGVQGREEGGAAVKRQGTPHAVIETSRGTITCRLFPDKAPKACENFTLLAGRGYYNGVIFHRVIPGFMIQGGDPTGTGRGGASAWGAAFEDEFDPAVSHDRPGVLSMANAGPGTNGSQFFITLAPTPWLDNRHTIFGEVVEGMETVRTIGAVETRPGDRPVTDVVMERVSVDYR
ncbi:MAG: peptidylprolyl isomerase [Chlamydiae bacterium]|jgi:peptidyl-prolyl cis-trans isomerase-like 1|nr:peptidylprolyl isomerase [Chlamydiota bacterium]